MRETELRRRIVVADDERDIADLLTLNLELEGYEAFTVYDGQAALDAVPDIGGSLTQWHVHDNLCYNTQGRVAGLTDSAGNCAPGLIKPVETPMIHVWIEPHRCGPFAALEGIGGGRIPEGETKLCDHAHGA